MTMLTAEQFRGHVAQVVSKQAYPRNQVNLDTLSALWEPAIKSGVGRAYANPDGFLLGMFITDPISGEKQAAQCLWLQADGTPGAIDLFRKFESDAAELKCARVLSGCVVISDMPRMRKLYALLGYQSFSENFSKTL